MRPPRRPPPSRRGNGTQPVARVDATVDGRKGPAVLGNAILLILAAAATANPATVEANSAQPAGSYEILICKSACSFSDRTNVVVDGLIVLMAPALTPSENQDLHAHGFRPVYQEDDPPNACFVLHTIVQRRTYAGIEPMGVTSWSLNGSMLRIDLYASSDAGYVANLSLHGERLEGAGSSWGLGAAKPDLGPDTVVGRRIGIAFPFKCFVAAHAAE